MEVTIAQFIKGKDPKSEDTLLFISDELWLLGDVKVIKEKVSHELFVVHIVSNVIGNYQGDGWQSIICDQPSLLPYIEEALNELDLTDIRKAFCDVLSVFPETTNFSDEHDYVSYCNFLLNSRFKINHKDLNSFTQEERENMVKEFHEKIQILEILCDPIWGYNAPNNKSFAVVSDYLIDNINASAWR